MATDSAHGGGNWPVPRFVFHVQWDSAEMQFQEVAGLDMEAQAIEYRAGDSAQFSTLKMPGIKKFSDVTMKKGIFIKGDSSLSDWLDEIKMNTIKRRQVTISLLDEAGAPSMVWVLSNAWPNKISGTDLKADGNEAAIETLVIAHEGLRLVQG